MSTAGGCAAVVDLLPDLALGILSGTERADVLAHLDRCSSCREMTSGFAATVDALPVLLGEEEPPPGFEARTLERLRAERDRIPRRSTLYRVLAVAALVAAVMIVSIAAVRIVDARTSTETTAGMTFAHMVGHSKGPAGHAVLRSGDERYLWLDVDYGVRSATYRLETIDAQDRVTVAGAVAVAGGHGSWGGEIHGPQPAVVRLVGDDGRVFCIANFDEA
jgi:Putative zinc-finger